MCFRDNKFHVFPHKSFLKQAGAGQNAPTEISGRVIKDGLAKGVRISGDARRAGLMLQAESKNFIYTIEQTNIRDF